MKIRKLLMLFLALLAVPCILSSCSVFGNHQTGSTEGETTSEIKKENIDYSDLDFMNTAVYEATQDGNFVNCDFFHFETETMDCVSKYEYEGGEKYNEFYCQWAIGKLVLLKAEEFANRFTDFQDEFRLYYLTKEEREEMLNSCLEEMEVLSNNLDFDAVPLTMYITLTTHIRNLSFETILFHY